MSDETLAAASGVGVIVGLVCLVVYMIFSGNTQFRREMKDCDVACYPQLGELTHGGCYCDQTRTKGASK